MIISYMVGFGKGFIIADTNEVRDCNIGWYCSECVWMVPGTDIES